MKYRWLRGLYYELTKKNFIFTFYVKYTPEITFKQNINLQCIHSSTGIARSDMLFENFELSGSGCDLSGILIRTQKIGIGQCSGHSVPDPYSLNPV